MKVKEKFGFKIGDECKLSEEYFKHSNSRRGLERRFKVTGFGKGWYEESVRVKRLDLSSGRTDYYHYTFLEKLRAGDSY